MFLGVNVKVLNVNYVKSIEIQLHRIFLETFLICQPDITQQRQRRKSIRVGF
jgi:hypothetical protein